MEEGRKDILVKGNEHELVPLQTDVCIVDRDRPTEESFITELRHNKETRFKLVQSLCVALAFMILGWAKGQLGTAFLDLLYITGVDLKKGSGFMTSYYAGRMLGSVLAGVIHSRINKYLIFVIPIVVNGSIVAAIPWCSYYEMMVAAHVIHGTSGGVLDVAITSEAITIWGPTARGRSYLQMLNASFAISGILAPLATAPFLLQSHVDVSTDQLLNISYIVPPMNEQPVYAINSSNVNLWSNATNPEASHLYIAFSISAGIAFIAAIPFIVLFLQSSPSGEKKQRKNNLEFIGNLSIVVKRLQFINVGIFSSIITAVDFTFGGYLSVFCVQYLNWTKTEAAMLTSVVFAATLAGRLGGIFIVQKCKSHTLMFLACSTCSVGFVGLMVSAHAHFNIGIWLSVCLVGVPLGIVWPIFLSWVNEKLTPMHGNVAAYLLVTSFFGAMVSPVLIGYLMENVSLLWFCYLCFIKSVIVVICVIFMMIYTRCMVSSNEGHNAAQVNSIERIIS